MLVQANGAQGQAADAARAVAGGGISAPGWAGQIDAREAARGATVNNAKLVKEGNALHVMTGPATTYWNNANKASGDYTVKATFTEPKYMSLNDHRHPYGIVIGGNDMGTANRAICTARRMATVVSSSAGSVRRRSR